MQFFSPLGEKITGKLKRISQAKGKVLSEVPGDLEATREIIALLRASLGVDFTDYKQTTVSRRIQKRLAAGKIKSISEYVSVLQKNPDELQALHRDSYSRVSTAS